MPSCWRSRDDRRTRRPQHREPRLLLVAVGAPGGRGRHARRPRLARGCRALPRRPGRGRRRGAGGRVRGRRADHRVLRLALADRGARPRGRVAPGCGGGRVLPLALPQRHAARRGRGRRPSRDQHGRATSDVARGLRAVAWERSAGQVVQILLTVTVLLVLPSPVHAVVPLVAVGLVAVLVGVVVAARVRAWPAIALASALVVAGHAATFVIAARSAGVTAPASELLPLGLLVLQAAALPNVGGWGPREGVTAWAFAAAGLGASLGVATAVVYGVIVFVASLPGAAVLVAAELRVPARLHGVADV